MADVHQQQVVMGMIDASARQVGAAMSAVVVAHGIGAATPITVKDSDGQEINTTMAQLVQMMFEAVVDLTDAIDDLRDMMTPPQTAKRPAPKRRKRKS